MTLVAGIDRPLTSSLPSRRDSLAAGFLRFGVELAVGMHVQLGDGRWAVVADEPSWADRGRVSVSVSTWGELVAEVADEADPERLLVGWGVRVRTRTPEEQRQYVEAVWAADRDAALAAITREGNHA